MVRFLAESTNYKVYSIYESVYLKHKIYNTSGTQFDPADTFVTAHYGDPATAIILPGENHVITAGCGLSIYDVRSKTVIDLFNAPDDIHWISGLYTDSEDNEQIEFRYPDINEYNQLRIFKLNIKTMMINEL